MEYRRGSGALRSGSARGSLGSQNSRRHARTLTRAAARAEPAGWPAAPFIAPLHSAASANLPPRVAAKTVRQGRQAGRQGGRGVDASAAHRAGLSARQSRRTRPRRPSPSRRHACSRTLPSSSSSSPPSSSRAPRRHRPRQRQRDARPAAAAAAGRLRPAAVLRAHPAEHDPGRGAAAVRVRRRGLDASADGRAEGLGHRDAEGGPRRPGPRRRPARRRLRLADAVLGPGHRRPHRRLQGGLQDQGARAAGRRGHHDRGPADPALGLPGRAAQHPYGGRLLAHAAARPLEPRPGPGRRGPRRRRGEAARPRPARPHAVRGAVAAARPGPGPGVPAVRPGLRRVAGQLPRQHVQQEPPDLEQGQRALLGLQLARERLLRPGRQHRLRAGRVRRAQPGLRGPLDGHDGAAGAAGHAARVQPARARRLHARPRRLLLAAARRRLHAAARRQEDRARRPQPARGGDARRHAAAQRHQRALPAGDADRRPLHGGLLADRRPGPQTDERDAVPHHDGAHAGRRLPRPVRPLRPGAQVRRVPAVRSRCAREYAALRPGAAARLQPDQRRGAHPVPLLRRRLPGAPQGRGAAHQRGGRHGGRLQGALEGVQPRRLHVGRGLARPPVPDRAQDHAGLLNANCAPCCGDVQRPAMQQCASTYGRRKDSAPRWWKSLYRWPGQAAATSPRHSDPSPRHGPKMTPPWTVALVAMVVMSGVHAGLALPAWASDFAPSDIETLNELGVNLTDVEKDLQDLKERKQDAPRTAAERLRQNLTSAARRLLDPAAFMTTPELIAREGYPVEVHKVETDDGYILELHRIPLPESKKPPVFLQHGILCSSSDWVIAGPEKGLAYILHRLGYDVWMGNFRGNRYSRRHRDRDNMDPDRNVRQFWDFSFHEKGVYDVPASIDFVLEHTGHLDLLYVGHSMGTTAFFVMLSERPAYNVKVRAMSALAPVSFMTQVQSPLLRVAAMLSTPLGAAANLVGIREFLPNNLLLTLAGQVLCREKAIVQSLCYNIMFLCTGFNSPQLNLTLLPTLLAHMPAGASVKTLLHYGQLIKSKAFRRYDYGMVRNMWHYGALRPPAYDLNNVRVPVSLHYSDNDWVAGPADVHNLYNALPNRMGRHRVKLPQFNHVDFLWGVDAPSLVYDTVTEILESQAARHPTRR